MNSDKILAQNNAIYNSLAARNIVFDRAIISDTDSEEDKISK